MRETLVITSIHDERGFYLRQLHLEDDGTLTIEGQHMGRGVSSSWGSDFTEYEFTRTLDREAVDKLKVLAMLGDGPLLDAIKIRFQTTNILEDFLRDSDIASTFWSRVGD